MTDAAKPATILDVARAAGVSHQTVSRYLRFEGGLKPTTSERIAAAIADLDYTPNLVARSMRTRRSGRLAIVLPAATGYSPGPIVAGAVAAARKAGYGVDALSIEGGADERTARVRELAASGQVEGILSLAPLTGSPRAGAPVVVSPDYDDDMRSIGDRASGSAVADLVRGLWDLGHRRFAHITGDLSFASARARRDVFVETTTALGAPGTVVEGGWGADAGDSAIRTLFDTGGTGGSDAPTALIAANDIVAGGAIRAARERGLTIPGDLSVTGWDDHALGSLLSPALTTVAIDHAETGRRAMRRLIETLRGATPRDGATPGDEPAAGGDAATSASASLHRVLWRESTGPAPR